MTIEQVKSAAEAELESLKGALLPLQNTWIEVHNKYWQGVQNPSNIPRDGANGTVDPDLARPPLPSWDDFGITLPSSIPYSVRCDEYVCTGCDTDHSSDTVGFYAVVLFLWGSDPEVWWTNRSRREGGEWADEGWTSEQIGPFV